MIVSTAENIEGFVIEEYFGLVSWVVCLLPSYSSNGTDIIPDELTKGIQDSIAQCSECMQNNVPAGANAIIGVKHSISDFSKYIIITTMGTAVRIIPSGIPGKENKEDETVKPVSREKAKTIPRIENPWEELDEYLKTSFNINLFLKSIERIDSAAKIKQIIESYPEIPAGTFSKELLHEIDQCIQIERMYGVKEGKNCFEKIKNHLSSVNDSDPC